MGETGTELQVQSGQRKRLRDSDGKADGPGDTRGESVSRGPEVQGAGAVPEGRGRGGGCKENMR